MDEIKAIYDSLGFVVINFDLSCQLKDGKWKKDFRIPSGWRDKAVSDPFGIHNAYAILTGKKSGVTVVDIDDPQIDSARALMEVMDETCSCVVKTKKGFHYYFKYNPALHTSTNDQHKIDIRNDKGMIICPPTEKIFNSENEVVAQYKFKVKTFITDGLAEIPVQALDFLKNMGKFNTNVMNDNSELPVAKETHIALRIISHLPTKCIDNYSHWLNIGIILFNEGLKCSDWDRISSRSTKYDPKGCKEKWETFNDYSQKKVTIATLWQMLQLENPQAFKTLMQERKDFWQVLSKLNHKDTAKYFYSLNPDCYLWNVVLGWYSLQTHNVWKHNAKAQPSGLKRHIADTMQSLTVETEIAEASSYSKLKNDAKGEDELAVIESQHKEKIRIIRAAYKSFGSSEFCNGVIAFLPSFYENDQLENLMDMNRTIFAFNDKCFDLTTLEFRDIMPLDFVSTTTGYDAPMNRNIEAEKRIRKFLNTLFEDTETPQYLLSVLASCLLGQNRWEELYFLTGTGGNGKGVIAELLKNVFGNYFYTVDISLFTKQDDRKDHPCPALVEARSKRIMISTEPEKDDKLQVGLLKKISGNDVIEARTLHSKDIVKYVAPFKVILQMNNIPQMSGIDGGVQRRFRIINFPFKFVSNPIAPNERLADPDVKLKLCMSEEWRNEFLHLLIETYKKIRDMKSLPAPASVRESTGDYVDDNNPLKSWLSKFYVMTNDTNDTIMFNRLKSQYMSDMGVERVTDNQFSSWVLFNNLPMKRTKHGKTFYGIKRITEEATD